MVLAAQTPWYVATVTSVLAILSKYVVRSRAGNTFNPAALAIVAMYPVFHAGQSWWGALPEVMPPAKAALLVTGVFIASRVNKLPLVVAFLGAYYLLFTITAFVSDPAWVSEVFRTPDVQAVLYFAFFILTDPPTSPVTHRDQLVFAAIVAGTSFVVFEWLGAVYYLLAGVLGETRGRPGAAGASNPRDDRPLLLANQRGPVDDDVEGRGGSAQRDEQKTPAIGRDVILKEIGGPVRPDRRLEKPLRFAGLHARTERDRRRHHRLVLRQVKQLLAVPVPPGRVPPAVRDLPLGAGRQCRLK